LTPTPRQLGCASQITGRVRRGEELGRRQLIDLIDRFPAALSAEQLRALTRPLAPRAYSIASSRGEVGEEAIKEASRYLRGTLAEGLAEAITGAVIEDDQQLVKFHGMYLQDDRDLRAERRRKKMEAAFAFMIRVPWPLRRSQRRYSAQAAVFANLCAPAKSRPAPSWASANSAASGSLRARNLAAAARCSRGSVNTITFAAGLGGSSMDVPNQQSCAIGLAA
jgi:hypothetical protein